MSGRMSQGIQLEARRALALKLHSHVKLGAMFAAGRRRKPSLVAKLGRLFNSGQKNHEQRHEKSDQRDNDWKRDVTCLPSGRPRRV